MKCNISRLFRTQFFSCVLFSFRQFRFSTLIALFLLFLLVAAGCYFMIDVDGVTDHPCQGVNQRCLPGYSCHEGICMEDPSTGIHFCSENCSPGKCDWRTGECADICAASICPVGSACTPGKECEPVESGLGAFCEKDEDCAGALDGCSVDPENPGRVLCACLSPPGEERGICLAIPENADDCDVCGDGYCIEGRFSFSGRTTLCVPGGFRTCDEGQAHCAAPDTSAWCTFLGWENDPGNFFPGEPAREYMPLGLLPYCLKKEDAGSLEPGDTCNPDNANDCAGGLCLPAGENHVCSYPCRRDSMCRGVSSERCVLSPLELRIGTSRFFDVAEVCGSAPALGRICSVQGADPSCGTDAPLCFSGTDTNICTRSCRSDKDCSPGQGFTCHLGRAVCR